MMQKKLLNAVRMLAYRPQFDVKDFRDRLFSQELTKEEKESLSKRLRSFMFMYLLPNRKQKPEIKRAMFLQYVTLYTGKVFFFGAPWFMKMGVNYLNNPELVPYAPYMFIGYGVCYSGFLIFESLRNYQSQKINQNAMNDIAVSTYSHLLNMDSEVHIESSARQSQFSIYKAQKAIESNLRAVNQQFIPMLVDTVLGCTMLFYNFGLPLTVTFAITYTAYCVFTIRFSKIRSQGVAQAKGQEKRADFAISQALQNFFTIKYFSAEKFELTRYHTILNKIQSLALFNVQTLGKLNSIQRVIFSAGMTTALLIGVQNVMNGTLTAGDVVLIQSLMLQVNAFIINQLFQPLFFLGVMHREWQESLLDIKDLFKILDMKTKIVESPTAQDFKYANGTIRFENVSYQYNEGKQILDQLNLEITGGEWVTVVGESGAGKSTLINLIFRLLDPTTGTISIDGQNLKDLKLASLRQHFGVVSQQSYLFNDTVRNNLMYGVDIQGTLSPTEIEAKEKYMVTLCERLGLSDLISKLPKGYDTVIGDQGNKFSGGERQRFQIVRCLLRGAKILLLDEPTSALDTKNEAKFMKVLEEIIKTQCSMTVLIISHRLHITQITDKVLYLGKHNKVSYGTHKEVLQQSPAFAKIWHNTFDQV